MARARTELQREAHKRRKERNAVLLAASKGYAQAHSEWQAGRMDEHYLSTVFDGLLDAVFEWRDSARAAGVELGLAAPKEYQPMRCRDTQATRLYKAAHFLIWHNGGDQHQEALIGLHTAAVTPVVKGKGKPGKGGNHDAV